MSPLDFSIVDPHIHQWDPYHTPHAAGHLVKLFGWHPQLMQGLMRVFKPKPLLQTLGSVEYVLQPYLPQHYKQDCGAYQVETVVHIEANWHHQKGFAVVEETEWIKHLPFSAQKLQLGAIVATADPRQRQFKQILQAHQQASPLFCGLEKWRRGILMRGYIVGVTMHIYIDKNHS